MNFRVGSDYKVENHTHNYSLVVNGIYCAPLRIALRLNSKQIISAYNQFLFTFLVGALISYFVHDAIFAVFCHIFCMQEDTTLQVLAKA